LVGIKRSNNNFFETITMTTTNRSRNFQVLLAFICALWIPAYSLSAPHQHRNSAEQQAAASSDGIVSRRSAIGIGLASLGTIAQISPARATTAEEPRTKLLNLIKSKEDDSQVMRAIEELVMLDPSEGRGATKSRDLNGEWRLLWSLKADAFSPLLKLPKPFKPDSYQYLGGAAKAEVGEDRVAQGLTGGILGNKQLWLSSGVFPSEEDPSVLDIQPPFRFQLGGRYGSGKEKTTIVEAGSDADFRKANGRTSDAQKAPKNAYKQLYLEPGGPGSLRISIITDGDPVIVGAIFVHEKM
jgi:hypothetical protein